MPLNSQGVRSLIAMLAVALLMIWTVFAACHSAAAVESQAEVA
jgi:hypothetical protein